MPIVKMPDGSLVELPDNPSPELQAQIRAKISGEGEKPSWLRQAADTAVRAGASAVAGFGKAASGAPTAMGMVLGLPELVEQGKDVNDYWSSFGEKHGLQGKYSRAAFEGAGSAMIPAGPIAPARAALAGGMAGVGAEAAATAFGDNALTRTAGGLVGGAVAGAVGAAKHTRASLAQEAMRDASEPDMRKAQELMRKGQSEGVTLNLSQAMPRPSNLDETVGTLAQSRHGKEIARTLRTQPQDVELLMDREVSALPGTARQPQVAANNVQQGADSAIHEGIKKAGEAWQQHAPQGSQIPPQAVVALDARLKQLAAQFPNTSGADLINDARAALKLRAEGSATGTAVGGGKITSKMTTGASQGPKYLTDALQLKGALDDALDTFGARKLNTPGLDAKNLRRAQEVRELFNAVVDEFAPNLSAANAAYSRVMQDIVAPMKQSVVGRVAGRLGYEADREAVQSRVFSVLDKGTTPGASTSEILALEKALRNQPDGPMAFQDAVKTWMANKVSAAAGQRGGRAAESTAADLERVFMGDKVKAQGTKDMLVAMARSQGLPDNALLPGMQNALKIISAAARRPAMVAGVTPQELDRASRSPVIGAVSRWTAIQPIRQPVKAIDDWLNADAYSFMDRLLTSPEGVDTLIKLGRQPVMSNAAVTTLATFAATANSGQPKAGQE